MLRPDCRIYLLTAETCRTESVSLPPGLFGPGHLTAQRGVGDGGVPHPAGVGQQPPRTWLQHLLLPAREDDHQVLTSSQILVRLDDVCQQTWEK